MWIFAVCGAVVAVFAVQRYNTPATNRHTTTAHLFFTSGAFYVAACLTLYVALSQVILVPGMLPFLGLSDAAALLKQYAAPPVLAAVVLTSMLPNVPYLALADQQLLRFFQKLGHIPFGVTQLADELAARRLAPTPADVADGAEWISRQPDVPNELSARLSAENPETPEGFFTTALMLHRAAGALLKEAVYRGFARDNAAAWQALRADFDVFAAQSHAFFVLFDYLKPRAATDASNDALKAAHARYQAIGAAVRAANAALIARAVTAVEPSEGAAAQRLRR